VLSNVVALDNRIPPRGFSRAAFAAFGGAPVGQAYADGQHWDDTTYTIPVAATRAEVRLLHQTTTREYAEFLRDAAPDASGQTVYDGWVARGRSAPIVMGDVTLDLTPICTPDGTACDDGDPCTTDETCIGGACVPGRTVPCPDDGNECTEDVCDSSRGACGVPRAGACDDGEGCTTADACAGGECTGRVDGIAGVRCVAGVLASADVCRARLPRPLRRRARKVVLATRKLAHRTKPRALDRARTGAIRALEAVAARAGGPAIEPACAARITRLARAAADALRR
jgi:hypothetical protein